MREAFVAVPFQQSVDELERLAGSAESLRWFHEGLLLGVQAIRGLPLTRVEEAYCLVSAAAVAGMLGKIRTTLVEMVADMTRGIPFDGLPSRAQVDSAVQVNVHGSNDQYHVNVGSNSGVIGQGAGSSQSQHVEGVSQDLATLFEQLRAAIREIDEEDDRADAERAVDDLDQAIGEENPDPQVVRSRWRALRRAADLFGGAFATTVGSESAQATIDMIIAAM
nr:hypothetical protein [Nocardia cyriacigeorgica]